MCYSPTLPSLRGEDSAPAHGHRSLIICFAHSGFRPLVGHGNSCVFWSSDTSVVVSEGLEGPGGPRLAACTQFLRMGLNRARLAPGTRVMGQGGLHPGPCLVCAG